MRKNIKISKLDAVKRQLETAITLYFNGKDPVSIHTLAAAAYNILRDLNNGRMTMLKDDIAQHVKPGMGKEARRLLNRYETFFKHAKNDPEGTLDFNPEATDVYLWEACMVYRELTDDNPEKMTCFNVWFKIRNPDLFTCTPEEELLLPSHGKFIGSLSKKEFFDLMLMSLNTI